MRELKFRAWDKEEKRMFIPIGYFYIDGYLTCIIEDKKTSQNNATEYLDETWYEEGRNPDYSNGKSSVVLMQNTGLKDKNGKEIFEGDLVRVDLTSDDISEEYRGRVFIWTANMRLGDDETHNIAILEPSHLEIIGNIFTNPELLEQ